MKLACGRRDASIDSPCAFALVSGLDSPVRKPVAAQLDALAHAFSPDLIHVHNVVNPDALDWVAARGGIATVQDHRAFCPGRGKLTRDGRACRDAFSAEVCTGCFVDADYFQRILRLTVERRDALSGMRAITVLSHYMARELSDVGIEGEKIHVIPPFVHGLLPDAEAHRPPCVLFVGRLVSAKGVTDVVEAWRRSSVGLPLVFAGTGSQRESLEAAGFEVLGWLSHESLSSLYRAARAVILAPRWQEPFGIVGLEALAMGVPVVAWDSGGIAEWLTGDTRVPYGDVDALAGALARAVEGRALRVPGFDRALQMDRLDALYRSLCQ